MNDNVKSSHAFIVLTAGVLFKLTIGILYVWTILKGSMQDVWGWEATQANLPYTLCIVMFAIFTLIGGRIQDKMGPRWIATCGGFFVGLGLFLSGYFGNNPTAITVCFGVLTGMGIGLGYSAATPAALKWFHASKKGLISGLVIGGFGLGPLMYAPITRFLLNNYGIEQTFMILGVSVLIISIIASQFIRNPITGYVPAEPMNIKQSVAKAPVNDITWTEMLKTKRFYYMIILFFFMASPGLLIIGGLSNIIKSQAPSMYTNIAFLVMFLAAMNFSGRLLGGVLSDKIGRINVIFTIIILQAINFSLFRFYASPIPMIIGIILTGVGFGATLSVFPALTADQFGLKNYGVNYGIVYLFWGFSALLMPIVGSSIYDNVGNYYTAFLVSALLMGAMFVVNVMLKRDIKS